MPRVIYPRLRFIEPQLASPLINHPRASTGFTKQHDGYRSQLVIEEGTARVYTRNGHDWSDRYPGIVRAASGLRCRSAIIDGEAIVQDRNGASDFLMRCLRPFNSLTTSFFMLSISYISTASISVSKSSWIVGRSNAKSSQVRLTCATIT